MSTITPLRTSTEFRDAIISVLGFTPEDSLVLIPTTPAGAASRINLDPLIDGTNPDVVKRIVTTVADSGVTDVAVVYFTTRNPASLGSLDAQLTSEFTTTRLHRATTLLFDDTPQGLTRNHLAVITSAPPAACQRATTAFETAIPDLADYLRALDRVRSGRSLPASLIGAAGACLTSLLLRDAVVVHMTGTTLPSTDQLTTDGLSDDLVATAMAAILDPQLGREPDVAIRRHITLLTSIISHLPNEHHAPARTLLALIAWWSGDGATANRHVEEALTADPDYRLAYLIACTFRYAIQPGWATTNH